MRHVRTLFVSDGPSLGGPTAAAIGADPAIEIVARIQGAEAGLAMLKAEQPDVLVLYASQPTGPERKALEQAARASRIAVVAVEAHHAPAESYDSLRRRVKGITSTSQAGVSDCVSRRESPARPAGPIRLIAIGASTGGVEALVSVLSRFPRTCPPTVVVQHMPPFFTTSFAARLHGVCEPAVHEAWDGAPLERGKIYIAPGGATHLEVAWGATRRVKLLESAPVNRHRPSVDVAFYSVARQLGQGAVGVLLTGMGRDGADGLRAMRDAGARTIAQDRETSTVFGMPRAALECGAADRGTPLERISQAIFNPDPQTSEVAAWR